MSVGLQLQQARMGKKLTIAQVAAATRIQPWVLEALEADRAPEQMSRIYLRGFLSSYARFLHLDPAPLLAELPSDQPPPAPTSELPPPPPKQTRPPISIMIPWQRLARVASAAAMAGVVALVIASNPVRLISQIPWPRVHLPKISLAELHTRRPATKVARAKPRKSTSAAKSAAVQAPERPARPPTPEIVAVRIPSEPQSIAVAAPEPVVIEPQVASIAPLQKTLHQPPLPSLETQATQPLEVLITASRTTWVRVRADGKLLAQERLKRGAQERWKAKSRLEVIVANPSQVELSLNGQSITSHAIAYQGKLLITHRGVSQLPTPE